MDVSEHFKQAVTAFDKLNAQDPNFRDVDGKKVPFELFFADKMSEWVSRVNPDASEPVLLAARCQHLCRWEIPRSNYMPGRIGYLKWRQDLKNFHADRSSDVLRKVGYDSETIEKVRSINLKQGLGIDPQLQVIEDALCLVFLEIQFDDLIAKTDKQKMISIIQKTWGKMSRRARSLAAEIKLSENGSALFQQALHS